MLSHEKQLNVKQNSTKSQRSLCAQLRLVTLPLAIDKGKFKSFPEEKNFVLLCTLYNLLHFLVRCPAFLKFRWLDDY